MTILSAQHSSRIRNRSMGVLHLIAADEFCEVSDILALIGDLANSPSSTPSQPPSQAPAARMSDQPSSDMQAEGSPQPSADHSPETAHEIDRDVQRGNADPAVAAENARKAIPDVGDGCVNDAGAGESPAAGDQTGKSGEAPASPAPVKRTRTKGRGKVVEASIRGNPDWTDQMHAEHLGVDPAYIRRTAVRLGLKLASRLSHRKAKQAATTEALKAAPAKPQKPVERAGPPTPRSEAPPPPAATADDLNERLVALHSAEPALTRPELARRLGAPVGKINYRVERLGLDVPHSRPVADEPFTPEPIPPANPQKPVAPPPIGEARTLTERVRALHQQHPTWTATMLARELGAKPTSVSTILSTVRGKPAAPPEQPQFTGRRQMVEHYGAIAKRLGKPS